MDTPVPKADIRYLTDIHTLLQIALFERRYSLRDIAQMRIEELNMPPETPQEADENGFVTVQGRIRGYFGHSGQPLLPEAAEGIDSLWPYISTTSMYHYNPIKSANTNVIETFLCVVWEPGVERPRKTVVRMSDRSVHMQEDRIAKAALAAISESADFCYIARNDIRAKVRRKAVNRAAKNEAFCLEIAMKDSDERVRLAAARRLVDNKSFDMLLREGIGAARNIAAEKTPDLSLLKETALAANDNRLFSIALSRVEDWPLIEVIAMLAKTKKLAKGLARARMQGMKAQWLANGLELLKDNQRLFADAAINDSMFYRLVIEYMTDEACIADILCSLSPHTAGATDYGPVGEAGWIAGTKRGYDPVDIARAKCALNRLFTKEALQKVAEQAKADYLRFEATKRLKELQFS